MAVEIPAPVGGTPFRGDFWPSIIFAILYGLLVPLNAYRLLHKRSRTTLLIGTTAFAVERIVIYSLRAVMSRNEQRRVSNGLIDYMQTSFAIGYIGIAHDTVSLLRCLLVNPTYGPERFPESAAAATKGSVMAPPPAGTPDRPNTRIRIRKATLVGRIAFIVTLILGLVANMNFHKAATDADDSSDWYDWRIYSTVICLVLCIIVFGAIIWGRQTLERMSKRGAAVLSSILCLLIIIGIYRLAVIRLKTDSLTSATRLDSIGNKAAFYLFHIFPEWLCSLILFADNIRTTFGTGPTGDYRLHDETPEEKGKRLQKEEKKRAKDAFKGYNKLNGVESGDRINLIPLGNAPLYSHPVGTPQQHPERSYF